MRHRDAILGIVVLALVAAGVYWARFRPTAADETPAAQVSEPAGQSSRGGAGGTGAPPSGRADRTPPGDDSLPDVTRADGAVVVDDLRITLSIAPRPPVAFTKLRVRVRVETASGRSASAPAAEPPAIEDGRISFEMTMPMGDHRYRLVAGNDGWHEAEVVLPFCASGNPRWYAIVQATVHGQPRTARFRLDLTRSSSSSRRTGLTFSGEPQRTLAAVRPPNRGIAREAPGTGVPPRGEPRAEPAEMERS